MTELPDIPLVGDEPTLLTAFLDYYRAALIERSDGLSDDQMHQALAPSTLTMSRLIGHMCLVEQIWFQHRFAGERQRDPWGSLDYDADFDAEMTLAQTMSRSDLLAEFADCVADSQRRTSAAGGLDVLSAGVSGDGEHWNLRWILIHMIEEYARHCGHADFIRQSIDGSAAP